MTIFVLDTSALLAYIEDEEGADQIEGLLQKANDGKTALYISTTSCIELFYISLQEQGEKAADERMQLVDNLMIIQEPVDSQLTRITGVIKANHTLSFADACIAGLAKFKNAKLVHKDPEFEQIEDEIEQLKLPYKPKRKKK